MDNVEPNNQFEGMLSPFEQDQIRRNVDYLMPILQVAGVDPEVYMQMLLAGKIDPLLSIPDDPILTRELLMSAAEYIFEMNAQAEKSLVKGVEETVWSYYYGGREIPDNPRDLVKIMWQQGVDRLITARPTFGELAEADIGVIRHPDHSFDIPLAVHTDKDRFNDPRSALRLGMGNEPLRPMIVSAEDDDIWLNMMNGIHHAKAIIEQKGGELSLFHFTPPGHPEMKVALQWWLDAMEGAKPAVNMPRHSVLIVECPELLRTNVLDIEAYLAAMGQMREQAHGVQLIVRMSPAYMAELRSGRTTQEGKWEYNYGMYLYFADGQHRYDWVIGRITDPAVLQTIRHNHIYGEEVAAWLPSLPETQVCNWTTGDVFWTLK